MKFQENSLKNVRNLIRIQDNIINYLIEKNNEAELVYFRENREKQEKFLTALKNFGNNSGIPKMKSFAYGPFGFNRKFNYEKKSSIEKSEKRKAVNKNSSTQIKKSPLKKMHSSVVITNPNMNISTDNHKKLQISKSNVLQFNKLLLLRVKSLDDKMLKVSKARVNEHKLKKEMIDQVIARKNSDNIGVKKVINKFREKFE
jgi:hypothetical protein